MFPFTEAQVSTVLLKPKCTVLIKSVLYYVFRLYTIKLQYKGTERPFAIYRKYVAIKLDGLKKWSKVAALRKMHLPNATTTNV